MEELELIRRTRALIGRSCVLNGEDWEILDVLSDEASIVLRRQMTDDLPIQEDAFGSPVRRVRDTRVVSIFSKDGDLTEEARELLLALQAR